MQLSGVGGHLEALAEFYRQEIVHEFVAFAYAPQGTAFDIGQRSPAVVVGPNDLTLIDQRRDRQNRVKRS
ncbi:hypothetical protein [Mycobacterium nebraskense]|uniref:hypothetical protein n=1 Tax=Mycobacterium nebraskense TaxID=244292 RepID=UPI000B1EC737|nr:hypothetical protein [Mycobacterium nebraskense]MBI2695373.1 hypothetical protein [Mycobacterium nebraskense]MCV7121353.1 hypothetical protein [Mycobacterium nebraskense]